MKQMIEDNGSLKLIFIRHAKPDYNDCGDRDCSDGDLDETGLAQCAALGEHYKDIHLDACFSSSLLRAFRTAAAICDAKPEKPLIEICPELIEGGTTPGYYGCSEEYLKRYYQNTKMCEKLYGTTDYEFGCEAFEDNVIRAEKVISYIKSRFSFGERVAVFSHHGFLEYLIPTALGVKPHIFRFSLDNISINVVELCRDGNAVLRYINK